MATNSATVQELVESNLPLVGHLAREMAMRLPRHLGTDDLIGAGSLALVQAAQSFDATLGVPFARFATTRIRGAMIDQMRQRDWATRSIRSRSRTIGNAVEELSAVLHRQPTQAEVATATGMSEEEVRAVQQGTDRALVLSLDPMAEGEDGLGATIEDSSPRPEEALIAAEKMGYLRDAIDELPERLGFVIRSYYLEQRPLTEIAAELQVTQSRASQLRAEGLGLLKEALSTLVNDGTTPMPSSPEGLRSRRRDSYVQAVAQRSTVGERANVSAYLRGEPLATAALHASAAAYGTSPSPESQHTDQQA